MDKAILAQNVHCLLSRLFPIEEINGLGRCPTYLYRWLVFTTKWLSIYVHRFVGDDWSLDLHDHPKRFVSIGLSGRYIETTPDSGSDGRERIKEWRAPWIRSFPAEHTHRLELYPSEECWTLVVVFRASRQWGFWHRGSWVHWRDYVDGPAANERKSCP